MEFGDIRGPLEKVISLLKSIDRHTLCAYCGSDASPVAATGDDSEPVEVASGFSVLRVTKTNASGTVTITFPDASTYVLSGDGESFEIQGQPLGAFTITAASSATFKFYAY